MKPCSMLWSVRPEENGRVIGSALLLVASLALFPCAKSLADDEDVPPAPATLTWQLEPSHLALAAEDSEFYLRVRAKAAKVETKREPINLAVVFDCSGSMKEEAKIDYVRQAGHLVTDNLTCADMAGCEYN